MMPAMRPTACDAEIGNADMERPAWAAVATGLGGKRFGAPVARDKP